MNKKRIWILEDNNLLNANLKKLSKYFVVKTGCKNLTELKERINSFDIIFVRLKFFIDESFISNESKLKIICSSTTGLNHIGIKKKDIKILSLKNCRNEMKKINSTCELTFALLLSLLRRIPYAFNDVNKGYWDRDSFIGEDIKDKVVGIIGYGRLGKSSAKLAKAFGAEVLTYDNSKDNKIKFNNLLKNSDIILVHISYEEENHHLFDLNIFKKMKTSCFFINTSRGEIVNQDDLIYALENKIIKGAALDVIDNEFKITSPSNIRLFDYSKKNDNLIITPHIGGLTINSLQKVESFLIDKLIRVYLSNKIKFK